MDFKLDELLAELSMVLARLETADGPERLRLEVRRDELREFLRAIDIDAQRPTSELLAEHEILKARVARARRERVKKIPGKYLGATQTVGGGVEPKKINEMIDAGNRIEELEERLARLTALLSARGAL